MLDPLIKTIEVPCGQEAAFKVFVNEMGAWWPLDKRSMSLHAIGEPAESLRVDPQLGGEIVEVGPDKAEYHWGTFTEWDPHDSVVLDFHMGLSPEQASQVTVTFAPLDGDRTVVTLVHSNWEAFGDLAEMMRNGYGSGWVIIFEQAFQRACGGEVVESGEACYPGSPEGE